MDSPGKELWRTWTDLPQEQFCQKISQTTDSNGCLSVCLSGLLLCFPLSLQFLLPGCLMSFNCQTLKKNGGEGESPRRHWQGKWQLCSRLLHAPMKTCQHHLGQFAVTVGGGGGLIFRLSLVNSIIVFQRSDTIQSEGRDKK